MDLTALSMTMRNAGNVVAKWMRWIITFTMLYVDSWVHSYVQLDLGGTIG